MDYNNIDKIKNNGFMGFKSVRELWSDRKDIPKVPGVYLVMNPQYDAPEYINPGVGGFFKGRNPNLPIADLEKNHVKYSQVIYIGKAGGSTGKATLHSRIGQYLRFGKTKNVGHWGGRLIWQLRNHPDLIFCWQPTPKDDPREVEKRLLADYINQFGQRPFANLTG